MILYIRTYTANSFQSYTHQSKQLLPRISYTLYSTLPVSWARHPSSTITFTSCHTKNDQHKEASVDGQEMAEDGSQRKEMNLIGCCSQEQHGKKGIDNHRKDHFVAYASDGKRYMVPLARLHRPMYGELLNMAEEEYGLNIDGAITLPFDSAVIDYIMLLLQRDMSRQTESALLASLIGSRCSSSSVLPQGQLRQFLSLEGF